MMAVTTSDAVSATANRDNKLTFLSTYGSVGGGSYWLNVESSVGSHSTNEGRQLERFSEADPAEFARHPSATTRLPV
jgi:hypothetical protein